MRFCEKSFHPENRNVTLPAASSRYLCKDNINSHHNRSEKYSYTHQGQIMDYTERSTSVKNDSNKNLGKSDLVEMIHMVNYSQQNIPIVMILVIILIYSNKISRLVGKLLKNNKTEHSPRIVFGIIYIHPFDEKHVSPNKTKIPEIRKKSSRYNPRQF